MASILSNGGWNPDWNDLWAAGNSTAMPTPNEPRPRKRKPKSKTTRPYQVHSKNDLAPYKGLRQIYGERKFQRPVKKPQRVSFLSLPLEIRLMIYGYHLILEKPIELWAETGDVYMNQKVRRYDISELKKLFWFGPRVNLGLLRTCKQVNMEAAEVFYGENEFRFSGLNGHMVAYDYATKIGPRNLGYFKSITMGMPFHSNDRGMYGENWNPSCWRRVHEIYDRMPFPYPAKKPWERWRFPRPDFSDSWCKLAWMLTKAYRLESISFVLPDDPRNGWSLGHRKEPQVLHAIDDLVAAKPFLEVHVVRMLEAHADIFDDRSGHAEVIKMLKPLSTCRIHLAAFDPSGQWYLAPQPYVDKRGGFVVREDLDASEDLVDVLPDVGRVLESTWASD